MNGGVRFHGYSYIPGVTLSGTIKDESVALRVGGAAAAHGTLHLGPHRALVGELEHRRVQIAESASANQARAARASGESMLGGALLTRTPTDGLGRLLDRLPAGLGRELRELRPWVAGKGLRDRF